MFNTDHSKEDVKEINKLDNIRIAVHNPVFLLEDQYKNFNGYNYIFTLKYASSIYITDYRKLWRYRKKLLEMNREDIKIIISEAGLNRSCDILVGFTGRPDKILHCVSRKYRGMKIYHVMDYVMNASKSYKKLAKCEVDYVMGYCDHSKYCEFFKKYYPSYSGRVISVPFGFGDRFVNAKEFEERCNKAIALGSVNPINDVSDGSLDEYTEFYNTETFTHKLRRAIVENREKWSAWIDDKLPTYPETKNAHYDPVTELNNYTMFINDAGLMNFPPARTYEGIACGCVMVAENKEIYKELGFIDSVNCILFEPGNYEQMITKIDYYMKHSEILKNIHKNALLLSKRYTHENIAKRLYGEIVEKYESWK